MPMMIPRCPKGCEKVRVEWLGCIGTLMPIPFIYDQNGHNTVPDPNTYTTRWRCHICGHEWATAYCERDEARKEAEQ